MSQTILVKYLTIHDYLEILPQLRNFACKRDAHTMDQLWLLQHYPVFTQGQAGKAEHILNPGTIPVVQSDRGGQVTYHGPGQVIVYFLLDIARKKISVRDLISAIEQAVVDLLQGLGIQANTNRSAPGIYVAGSKICSIGLRVRQGRTYHGISLNVNMDLEPFSRINPCGYPGMQMTQISDFVENISLDATMEKLVPLLTKSLNYKHIIYEN